MAKKFWFTALKDKTGKNSGIGEAPEPRFDVFSDALNTGQSHQSM